MFSWEISRRLLQAALELAWEISEPAISAALLDRRPWPAEMVAYVFDFKQHQAKPAGLTAMTPFLKHPLSGIVEKAGGVVNDKGAARETLVRDNLKRGFQTIRKGDAVVQGGGYRTGQSFFLELFWLTGGYTAL